MASWEQHRLDGHVYPQEQRWKKEETSWSLEGGFGRGWVQESQPTLPPFASSLPPLPPSPLPPLPAGLPRLASTDPSMYCLNSPSSISPTPSIFTSASTETLHSEYSSLENGFSGLGLRHKTSSDSGSSYPLSNSSSTVKGTLKQHWIDPFEAVHLHNSDPHHPHHFKSPPPPERPHQFQPLMMSPTTSSPPRTSSSAPSMTTPFTFQAPVTSTYGPTYDPLPTPRGARSRALTTSAAESSSTSTLMAPAQVLGRRRLSDAQATHSGEPKRRIRKTNRNTERSRASSITCGYVDENGEVCTVTFGRETDRKRHNRVHEGNPVAVCNLCGQEFFRKDTFERHKKCRISPTALQGRS
ncbi:hypothetical protein BT69DRAFT_1278216 [Atractiella rhizophila]|nr:hypothetical protein BT69DRAFT_1278216 [Atractiella rhizophila]